MKLMTFVFVAMAVCVTSLHAAPGVPSTINLQGRLTDVTGDILRDGEYTITFRIYGDDFGGSALWEERLPVQVTGGLFSVVAGNINAIPADIFSESPYRFLGVTVDPEPELPRIPFSSVAYAFQAQGARIATLALDLICSGCVSVGEIAADAVGPNEIATDAVGSDEIAPESVGAAEIGFGAVGASEIATNAVGTSEVADGSLTAVDIADEPGVASWAYFADISMDGTVKTLISRTITAPAAGYVLVIATAQVHIDHSNGTLSNAQFGVSSTAGVFPDNQDVFVEALSSAPTGFYKSVVTVHGLFATPGGPDEFFFLGRKYGGGYTVDNFQLSLIYFPTAYGTVVATATPGSGEILSDQSAATDTNMIEPVSEMAQGVNANQPVSKQELALMRAELKAEMDTRIRQIEESIRQARSGIEEKR